jgi:hypothetical protein
VHEKARTVQLFAPRFSLPCDAPARDVILGFPEILTELDALAGAEARAVAELANKCKLRLPPSPPV